MKNMKSDMKNIREWAEDKDPFIVVMSLSIAGFANEFYDLSKSVHKGKRLEGDIHLPKYKNWLKFYNNQQRIIMKIVSALLDDKTKRDEQDNIVRQLFESEILIKIVSNMIAGKKEILSEHEQKHVEEFREEVINNFNCEIAEQKRNKFQSRLIEPEIIFGVRVTIPCFVFYKTTPDELLRKAQRGDDVALEQLIRLDKSAIFDPKISEIVHQAQALKQQGRMSMIKKAFSSKPKVPLKMTTIKFQLGGIISFLSLLLNEKLNAVDIRKMYDAIACDAGKDNIDTDFGYMTHETFAKNIQDYRKMWEKIITSGKKII